MCLFIISFICTVCWFLGYIQFFQQLFYLSTISILYLKKSSDNNKLQKKQLLENKFYKTPKHTCSSKFPVFEEYILFYLLLIPPLNKSARHTVRLSMTLSGHKYSSASSISFILLKFFLLNSCLWLWYFQLSF